MGPSLLMNCQWSRPAARKGDALRLVAVEKAWISAPLEHRCELPGEVDGVSDAGVHALLADGAVDMGGVAEEEGAAFAEMLRHPVMDVIRSKTSLSAFRQIRNCPTKPTASVTIEPIGKRTLKNDRRETSIIQARIIEAQAKRTALGRADHGTRRRRSARRGGPKARSLGSGATKGTPRMIARTPRARRDLRRARLRPASSMITAAVPIEARSQSGARRPKQRIDPRSFSWE
jgi:hypothetical protein